MISLFSNLISPFFPFTYFSPALSSVSFFICFASLYKLALQIQEIDKKKMLEDSEKAALDFSDEIVK